MVISFPIDFRIKYLQDVLNVRAWAYASEHLKLVNVPLPLKHLMRRDTNINVIQVSSLTKNFFYCLLVLSPFLVFLLTTFDLEFLLKSQMKCSRELHGSVS